MPALAVKPKLASGQKTSFDADRIIDVASLVADLPQERDAANDELASDQNVYSYVNNNPLSFTDPSGHGLRKWAKRVVKKYGRTVVAVAAAVVTAGAATPYLTSAFASGFTAAGVTVGTAANIAAGFSVAMGYAAGGYVGGAIGGGILCGSDCARPGAQAGAWSGGLFAGANIGIGAYGMNPSGFGAIGVRSTTAGVSADVTGGSFSQGFQTSFGIESFNQAALYMRDTAWRWASANPDNLKGPSSGLWGDGRKLAGSWPGANGGPICAPLGCQQGGAGKLFGMPYSPNGPANFVLEAFSGPHDFLDRPLYNLETGNLQSWANGFGGYAYAALTVAPAAPFALASMVQPVQQFVYPLQNLR